MNDKQVMAMIMINRARLFRERFRREFGIDYDQWCDRDYTWDDWQNNKYRKWGKEDE